MSVFYDRFIQLCVKKQVSASAAANAIGLTNTSATGWKNGNIPRDTTINKLAMYFDCAPEYLKGTDEPEEKEETPTVQKDSGDRDETYEALIAFIASSTEAERQELINYSKYIKSKRSE